MQKRNDERLSTHFSIGESEKRCLRSEMGAQRCHVAAMKTGKSNYPRRYRGASFLERMINGTARETTFVPL